MIATMKTSTTTKRDRMSIIVKPEQRQEIPDKVGLAERLRKTG